MSLASERPKVEWEVNPHDPARVERLVSELGISPLMARILDVRGWHDPEATQHFLNPSMDDLLDPFGLPDMAAGVAVIMEAKLRGDLVYVHGDYDADGVTSAALLTRFLQRIGVRVIAHVPHRMKEGYGIHDDAVQAASEAGAKVFLTCDCGVRAHSRVDLAHELGMKVVVTDHHDVGETLPNAEAVINPKRPDSTYGFAELAGVGVALKFAAALSMQVGHTAEHAYRAYMDLATIGTVADIVPLRGENRAIVRLGLPMLRATKKPGLRALLATANLAGKPLRSYHCGYVIGPRLNAPGRIDDAALPLQLLLSEDENEARLLAQRVEQLNEERKTQQDESVAEAIARLPEGMPPNLLVMSDPNWHPGIIGLIAGKIREQIYRPTIALSEDHETGIAKASCRSIPGFNIGQAVDHLRGLILDGGGHEQAAGFSVMVDKLDAIKRALADYADANLAPELLTERIAVDAEVNPGEANEAFVAELSKLEPYGASNSGPVFLARNVRVEKSYAMKEPRMSRGMLRHGERSLKYITWRAGESVCEIGSEPMDILFEPEMNEYQGTSTFQYLIRDCRPSQSSPEPSGRLPGL